MNVPLIEFLLGYSFGVACGAVCMYCWIEAAAWFRKARGTTAENTVSTQGRVAKP